MKTNILVDPFISGNGSIRCNYILGVRYDTFGYIKIDHKEAYSKFADAKKELTLLPIGGNLKI